ncbi:hypothetical protein EVAR_22944_1 [Eumeta japonica]|uniref:Uncharacterized protein n=1 Tax=Eumeta variegata TaxID=151549 RepID=A0A4C1UVM7_EUMVA|nr:hypothetical protein EVAR_22944_1 [Eumeta japonica]
MRFVGDDIRMPDVDVELPTLSEGSWRGAALAPALYHVPNWEVATARPVDRDAVCLDTIRRGRRRRSRLADADTTPHNVRSTSLPGLLLHLYDGEPSREAFAYIYSYERLS